MPVAVTLLGTATGSGVDLDIPISVDQPVGSVVLCAGHAYTGPTHFAESQGFRSDPTDSEGGTWSGAVGRPSVGNTGAVIGPLGGKVAGNIDSSARIGGPLLKGGSGPQPRPGCTTCGSMLLGTPTGTLGGGGGGGDTVTLHWFDTNADVPNPTAGIVFAFEGVQNQVETSDQDQYGNGDAFPVTGSVPDALIWATDLGPSFLPTPAADCVGYTVASGRGNNAWVPVNGNNVVNVIAGTTVLALSVDPAVSSSGTWEPGGTYDTNGSILVANYQFVRLL